MGKKKKQTENLNNHHMTTSAKQEMLETALNTCVKSSLMSQHSSHSEIFVFKRLEEENKTMGLVFFTLVAPHDY